MQPRTKTREIVPVVARTNQVTVVRWAYRVDYGPHGRPRWHMVHPDQGCHCPLGTACPAVTAVDNYLAAGGEQAGDPPFDVWPQLPRVCPICGSPVSSERGLDSRAHGHGWRCRRTGLQCYWAARIVPLFIARAAHPGESGTNRTTALPAALAVVRGWVKAYPGRCVPVTT
jgi:hypothetical protein